MVTKQLFGTLILRVICLAFMYYLKKEQETCKSFYTKQLSLNIAVDEAAQVQSLRHCACLHKSKSNMHRIEVVLE